MILIIDNYDSFTYNLVQMVEQLYHKVMVIKNDTHTIDDIKTLKPKGIILSPGPCTPNEAGICLNAVQSFYKEIPILGICLGHQTIAQAFGSQVIKAKHLVHGKLSSINHDGQVLFHGLQTPIRATRYHSLIVDDSKLSSDLRVTSRSNDDHYIMGLRHVKYPTIGIQFHPESYQTKQGHTMIENFVNLVLKGGYNV